jgi:hypothetical protein
MRVTKALSFKIGGEIISSNRSVHGGLTLLYIFLSSALLKVSVDVVSSVYIYWTLSSARMDQTASGEYQKNTLIEHFVYSYKTVFRSSEIYICCVHCILDGHIRIIINTNITTTTACNYILYGKHGTNGNAFVTIYPSVFYTVIQHGLYSFFVRCVN